MRKTDIITKLNLTPHMEGGYFARTYSSSETIMTKRLPPQRLLMSSIYYLLTDDSPIGYFHLNSSDILHFFHDGSPLTYIIIQPDGQLEKFILGNDLSQNQTPQLLVKGGCWKASVLEQGEFGLISEAVSPGFEYSDNTLANQTLMKQQFPHLWHDINRYIRNE